MIFILTEHIYTYTTRLYWCMYILRKPLVNINMQFFVFGYFCSSQVSTAKTKKKKKTIDGKCFMTGVCCSSTDATRTIWNLINIPFDSQSNMICMAGWLYLQDCIVLNLLRVRAVATWGRSRRWTEQTLPLSRAQLVTILFWNKKVFLSQLILSVGLF